MGDDFLPEPEYDSSEPGAHHLGLGVMALAAVVLGIWQIRNSISLPFAPQLDKGSSVQQAASADMETLKNRDTDGDGLSDYDETYLYHTSIYLKDTDSDGIDDKTEVERGTDPNCPNGQTCQTFTAPVTNQTDNLIDNTAGAGAATNTTPTAQQIRDLLKKNGATDEVLNKYDDATLLNLYNQEVANQNSGQGSVSTTPAAGVGVSSNALAKLNLTTEQKQAIANMSGAQLRQFLIQAGADAATLQGVDDTSLQTVVKQMLGL